jgi:hypothetical protein
VDVACLGNAELDREGAVDVAYLGNVELDGDREAKKIRMRYMPLDKNEVMWSKRCFQPCCHAWLLIFWLSHDFRFFGCHSPFGAGCFRFCFTVACQSSTVFSVDGLKQLVTKISILILIV